MVGSGTRRKALITIINYGLGNIKAFANLYKRQNIDVRVVQTADELIGSSKLILPGVGSFDHAMQSLNQSGMRDTLDDLVLNKHVPIIGICVGMQMLAFGSDEGREPGLGWVPGQVKQFAHESIPFKPHIPHMGWNSVRPIVNHPLFYEMPDPRFYFLHSYYFEATNPEDVMAHTDYGVTYACAVRKNNIYGVQFHPEKSHDNGVKLLTNFARLI